MEQTNPQQLAGIRAYLKQLSDPQRPLEQIRREMSEAPSEQPTIVGLITKPVNVNGLYGEWVSTAEIEISGDGSKPVVLYFHGGGFVAGTCRFYRDMAARISHFSGVQVLTFEYRLAPEHPYPAANEDALTAYYWLIEQGYSASQIMFGGDSVGATLALMTLITLRDRREALPVGAFMISPHADLVHLDGDSYVTNKELDPTGSLEGNERILAAYLSSWQSVPPEILSPLRMNLTGLPPLFIQVGSMEVLLSDAVRLREQAEQAGVDVTLEIWDNMWSVFHFLAYMLPEAEQAIRNIGMFNRQKLLECNR
ncbi:alpha/beta hydrolase [Paenibacillus zeisoli]|uniref:Alpha/beta hydrolase n=1 Tax=Paenibacillus zeisoli TaxID=2496267 RepID=A0A433XQB0_9BACL|nr:alpha/beta hydrolase [Paenibacillus zeisoli]RUT36226.1 alpha/beta hydrolase [Paenibacillus zeisoli]